MYEKIQEIKQLDINFYKSVSADNEDGLRGSDKKYHKEFIKFDDADFIKLMLEVHTIFIKHINRYFREKYRVTIEDKSPDTYLALNEPQKPNRYCYSRDIESWKEEFNAENDKYLEKLNQYNECIINSTLNFDCIVDDIFITLDGFTFEERVEKEIKEDVQLAVTRYGNGEPKYLLKSKKISFDILRSHKCRIFQRYEVSLDDEKYRALLRALTFFDSDKNNISIYNGWSHKFISYSKTENDGIYDTHYAGDNKVMNFKFYKNGKFEVEFKNYNTAVEFAREFLGYKEEQA